MLFDCSTVGVIFLGIVCVLMLGQIDLSVGSMSGFASAVVGTLWVNAGWPVALAIVIAVAAGGLVGAVYAALFNRRACRASSRPSPACSRSWDCSCIARGDGFDQSAIWVDLVNFGQLLVMPPFVSYALCVVPGIVIFVAERRTTERRRLANLSARSLAGLLLQAAAITVALELIVFYLNRGQASPGCSAFSSAWSSPSITR